MVLNQCETATLANMHQDGEGSCYCQFAANPNPVEQEEDDTSYMTCVLERNSDLQPGPTRYPTPKPTISDAFASSACEWIRSCSYCHDDDERSIGSASSP